MSIRSLSERNDNKNNNRRRISCSPSKSYSTCSSPSSTQTPNPSSSTRKPMEEVWNDINLSCLQDCPSTTVTNNTNHPAFPGMILQDFLARPLNKDHHRPSSAEPSSATASLSTTSTDDFLNSLGSRPATMLSLNSGSDFHFLESGNIVSARKPNNGHASSFLGSSLFSPFDDALASASACKKRGQENDGINSKDRRHKRMIKNRESAARSRARKQAYTQELELEVAHLLEENARLRRQQEKLLQAAPAKLPKKHNLYRTLTAPF